MSEVPENTQDEAAFDWKAFSQKTWVVVGAGLFLPPLGILLAWLKPDWSTRGKWIATGLMGIALINLIAGPGEGSKPTDNADSTSRQDAASAEKPSANPKANDGGGTTSTSPQMPVITADDLVAMNPAAVAKKLPKRFIVTGRTMETKTRTGSWGRTVYAINISGDATGFQRLNERGYVGQWVECEFSDDTGLENIVGGQFIKVEGQYFRNLTGDVVEMTKCKLVSSSPKSK